MIEEQLSEHEAWIVRAALIMVRDNADNLPLRDVKILRRVIDNMMPEGVTIVLRREP